MASINILTTFGIPWVAYFCDDNDKLTTPPVGLVAGWGEGLEPETPDNKSSALTTHHIAMTSL